MKSVEKNSLALLHEVESVFNVLDIQSKRLSKMVLNSQRREDFHVLHRIRLESQIILNESALIFSFCWFFS